MKTSKRAQALLTQHQIDPEQSPALAATLLEYATRKVRGSRPPAVRMPRTIGELKALNRENGGCWFDKSTMRFFRTRIESGIIHGNRFITSEQSDDNRPRLFTVREFDNKGSVDTVGEFHSHSTRAAALAAAAIK